LVEECYKLSRGFPREELFGLTGQLRRAAVSIPTNVAEGHSRRTRQAYANHISIALGSQAEVETLLEVAARLQMAPADALSKVIDLANTVGRILYGLHRALDLRDTAGR
jgi:four helix bundle protein